MREDLPPVIKLADFTTNARKESGRNMRIIVLPPGENTPRYDEDSGRIDYFIPKKSVMDRETLLQSVPMEPRRTAIRQAIALPPKYHCHNGLCPRISACHISRYCVPAPPADN
jgi:hypothetical protein